MENKKNKIILMAAFAVCIVLYSIYIIYANKAHGIFSLEDPALNQLLYRYSDVSKISGSLFILCILISGYIFLRMNDGQKLKGLAQFLGFAAAVSLLCFCLEYVLELWNRKPLASLIQFFLILFSAVVFYFICCIYRKLKLKLSVR